MKLLLVRHAKAEERDASRWPDDSQRPLSDRGIKQFRQAAKQLGRSVTPDVALTSPFVRAVQTAEILHETAGWPEPEIVERVARSKFEDLVEQHMQIGTASLAIVGHEPSISVYISRLITGGFQAEIRIRPGTAALLKLDSPHTGTLQWLAPTQLFR